MNYGVATADGGMLAHKGETMPKNVTLTCPRCNRPLYRPAIVGGTLHGPLVRVRVVHESYGCDTGCCGHKAIAYDAEGRSCEGSFEFDAPYTDDKEKQRLWATSFAAHAFPGTPFDWEDSEVIDD